MLSKSQARTFFLGFTILFSGVFLALTVDSIRQVPARSHEDQMTADVVAGKQIWEKNNCMGCHTLLGEGAYYAPELTKAVERRGEPWLRAFLKDPAAMYPGRRQMVQYNFTDQEITQVIAFLDWIGKIDANGFPFKPDMGTQGFVSSANAAVSSPVSTEAISRAPATFKGICMACHAVGGQGGNVGPALDGVANKYTPEKLDAWLRDPSSIKPGTAMPKLPLDDGTRAELVTWLMGLR